MIASRRLLLAAVLCACAAGCKRAPQPPAPPPRPHVRVVDIEASDRTPEDLPFAGAAPPAELAEAARQGLLAAGVEVAAPGAGSTRPGPEIDFRLRLEVRLDHVPPAPGTEGRGLLRALAHGRLQVLREGVNDAGPGSAAELGRFDQEALAEKTYTGAAPDRAAWAAHARRVARDTAAALGAQVALLQADRQTLVNLIGRKDADPDLRGVAIELAGLRKERDALPALFVLLRDPDGTLRDKAIGALVEIGDRSAVKPLASSAQFQDTLELGKILEAVASLGGDEARSYLEFVASGHHSEQIRAEARVGLSHLLRREGQPVPDLGE